MENALIKNIKTLPFCLFVEVATGSSLAQKISICSLNTFPSLFLFSFLRFLKLKGGGGESDTF